MKEVNFDINTLLEFIWKAHQNTYAAPADLRNLYRNKTPMLQGFVEYRFVDGDWKYHDVYAGRRWPPGKEIIFYKNMPVWCMSYQGKVSSIVEEEEVTSTYSFLKNALRASDVKRPFRGPKRFLEGDFEYTFDFVGDYSYFVGRESVRKQGDEVFFQDIMGSLIK